MTPAQQFAALTTKAKLPSKYRNKPTMVDGVRFASKREAARFGDLQNLQRAGEISELRRQVPYVLSVNGVQVTRYIADAVYKDSDGTIIVEDSKGVQTEAFKIKRKLFRAVFGMEIVLT